jgi:hypothetical protein
MMRMQMDSRLHGPGPKQEAGKWHVKQSGDYINQKCIRSFFSLLNHSSVWPISPRAIIDAPQDKAHLEKVR